MKYSTVSPSPLLQPFVIKYYQVNGYTSEVQPYKEFTAPNGLTSFVFHFGPPIHVSNVAYDGKRIHKFYIFGKYTKPIFVSHTFGKVDVFGVIFQPGSFYHFLNLPQQNITNKLVEVRDGLGKEMDEIIDRMYHHPMLKSRKQIIEAFFIDRLNRKGFQRNVVDAVLEEIKHLNGNIKVKDLAKKFNASRQHLNRLFLPRVGLNIKEYASTLRFNRVLQAISSNRCIDLMQAVADFGYYDESHLIKDFHHFTQGRPSDFLNQENELAKFLMDQ